MNTNISAFLSFMTTDEVGCASSLFYTSSSSTYLFFTICPQHSCLSCPYGKFSYSYICCHITFRTYCLYSLSVPTVRTYIIAYSGCESPLELYRRLHYHRHFTVIWVSENKCVCATTFICHFCSTKFNHITFNSCLFV